LLAIAFHPIDAYIDHRRAGLDPVFSHEFRSTDRCKLATSLEEPFVRRQLRRLRRGRKPTHAEMVTTPGIRAGYVNLLDNNQRSLSVRLQTSVPPDRATQPTAWLRASA
jgi:hypothetical protein